MKAKLKIQWEKECKVEKILEVEQKYNKLKNKREEIFRNRESIHIWLWLIGVPERTPSKQMEVKKKKKSDNIEMFPELKARSFQTEWPTKCSGQ